MKSITLTEFAGRLRDRLLKDQPVVWFLGAGCSITSGIPAAGGLVSNWLRELYDIRGQKTPALEAWAQTTFASYDAKQPARSYAEVFESRYDSASERQFEIERLCAGGKAGYGYATFAQIITDPDVGPFCNTVLTTNFDDLIAEAIYLYGREDVRPQLITHEAIARYARISSKRPTIVKLHGDAHLDPKNLVGETLRLDDAVARHLHPFIRDSALVFIGYGGNDESVAHFLGDCPEPGHWPPVYWFGRDEPSPLIRTWLDSRSATGIDHVDFDRAMHVLRGALKIKHPTEERWTNARTRYFQAHETFDKEIRSEANPELKSALQEASSTVAASLPGEWALLHRARSLEQTDPDQAEALYLQAIDASQGSAVSLGSIALFFDEVRKDTEKADEFHERAIEADPGDPDNLGNYALFLRNHRKGLDVAETFYKRAIEVDPNHANNLGNYALFLSSDRKDLDAAEGFYKRAIEADPHHANTLSNYAVFLSDDRKDLDAAETFYKRAIEADPNDATILGNYALFLKNSRKDLDAAETFYKRAIEADPNDANTLGAYAVFLRNDRQHFDAAETFYKRAIEADGNDARNLGNYANFLSDDRKDLNAAETFYKRAIEADPNHANSLGNYALFFRNDRKDFDAAETFYKRAIEADPDDATNLGNYATFLNDDRKDLDAAETFYKRAIEADPNRADTLGNYANFLSDDRKDLDAAEIFYKRAIEADPDDAHILGNYALFLRNDREDFDAAETFYKRAIEADPNDATILGNYALFLKYNREDLNAAETFYKRAIEADPNDARTLGNYARFLRNDREDFDAAETFYKRAIEAAPNDAFILGSYAILLGCDRGDLSEAGAVYTRAIEIDPGNSDLVGNYAGLLLAHGKNSEGLAKLAKALALPGSSDALLTELQFYAFAHGSTDDQGLALKALKQLIDKGARSPGWDLSANVSAAVAAGHPEGGLVADLAQVISDGAEASILDQYPAWRDA